MCILYKYFFVNECITFKISYKISFRTLFIIHWCTDPPTLLFGKLEKTKIESICFLFPLVLIFILTMDQNIKNNKNSALIPQYTKGSLLTLAFCEISIYFCSFTIIKMLHAIFVKC